MTATRRTAAAAGALGVFTAAAGGLVGPVSAANALPMDLIENGSFEVPDVPSPGYQLYNVINGWTSPVGQIEIQDNVAGAPDTGAGQQFVELGSDTPSTISQTVMTAPGTTYRLAYLYSPRPNTAAAENKMAITAGSAAVTVSTLTTPGANTAWSRHTLDFVATAGMTTISFADMGTGNPGLGPYLDEVSLYPVEVDCSAPAPMNAIVGTSGGNIIHGTSGNDVIFGGGGGDVIYGEGGNDVICGGPGGDVLYGGDGNDILDGGGDGDVLRGGDGDDTLRGGPGGDVLNGQAGVNTNDGGNGSDVCSNPAPGSSVNCP